MAVFLVPVEDGRPIILDKPIVLIGRQTDCDVVLTNSRRVSRRHCCVAQINHSYVVRDLGSMNGVRVNGKRITREAKLEFGDVISFGDVPYRLQERAGLSAKGTGSRRRIVDRNGSDVERPPVELSREYPVPLSDHEVADIDSIEPAADRRSDSSYMDESESDDPQGRNSHFEVLSD